MAIEAKLDSNIGTVLVYIIFLIYRLVLIFSRPSA